MIKGIILFFIFFNASCSLCAIPPEFNLRKNEGRHRLGPEEPLHTREQEAFYYSEVPPEDPMQPQEKVSPFPPPNLEKETRVPETPDSIMLSPTELHITPQKPRHLPERPRKPQGTPPPPLPQHQQERFSSSPH